MQKQQLSFWQMWNLSFGFFGVQIAYALQSANISRIFATLGADPHQLSFFWILPSHGHDSAAPDRQVVRPHLVQDGPPQAVSADRRHRGGARDGVPAQCRKPQLSSRLLLGLNGAMWFGLFSLMLLDTSINVAMQPFKMMVGDMVGEEQKAKAYSIQSLLCNAGSLVGYLFPIFFTWIGIANTAPKGVIPSVIWSFYCGAAILLLCVLYTFAKVREMPPKEYAGIPRRRPAGAEGGLSKGARPDEAAPACPQDLLDRRSRAVLLLGRVHVYVDYTNGAVAVNCWGTSDPASEGYQAAGNWVGVVFAAQAVGSILWSMVIPRFRSLKTAYVVSLLIGAAGFVSIAFIHNQYLLFGSYFLIGTAWPRCSPCRSRC